jgi:hypothetical protein
LSGWYAANSCAAACAPPASRANAIGALEDPRDGPFARRSVSETAAQQIVDLSRAPPQVLVARFEHRHHDVLVRRQRGSTLVFEPFEAILRKPFRPLMARRPAHTVLAP